MSEWVRLCAKGQLPPAGQAKEFAAGGRAVCLANVNGKVTAMDNECPHNGGPLSEGTIEHGKLICPWHGWAFRMSDGGVDGRPGERVQLYRLQEQGPDVLIEIEGAAV